MPGAVQAPWVCSCTTSCCSLDSLVYLGLQQAILLERLELSNGARGAHHKWECNQAPHGEICEITNVHGMFLFIMVIMIGRSCTTMATGSNCGLQVPPAPKTSICAGRLLALPGGAALQCADMLLLRYLWMALFMLWISMDRNGSWQIEQLIELRISDDSSRFQQTGTSVSGTYSTASKVWF